MSIRNLAATAALGGSLLFGAAGAAALDTPFYSCIQTEAVKFDGSIVDAAVATPELSTLVTAVTVAGLVDALATTEGLTVYAPTDEAFGKIPAGILDEVLADPAVLTQVLTYHVTTTPAWRADPRRASTAAPVTIDTLQGQRLFLSTKGGLPMVNQAMANCQVVEADNGYVWIIDSVLMPQF
jgi:uncharacterized surface protein with fasciclin (FAS1) repeats